MKNRNLVHLLKNQLIHEKVSLRPNVLLSKTLWDDSKVFSKIFLQ